MLKILTLIFLTIIIILYLVIIPTYRTSLTFHNQIIKIDRDQFAIPHINAPSRRAFLYTLGYVLAQDRLFQMAFRRLYGSGRLSEFLGEKTLHSDIMMRDLSLVQLTEHLQTKTKTQNETIYRDLQAIATGINDQAAQRIILPLEFHFLGLTWQNYTLADLYLGNKVVEWSLSHNLFDQYTRSALLKYLTQEQLEQLMPNTQEHWAFPSATVVKEHQVPSHLYGANIITDLLFDPVHIDSIRSFGAPQYHISGQGSNSWVVSGALTESGKPILSNDPHMDNVFPSVGCTLRSTYTHNNKTVNFAGFTSAGMIGLFGKNNYFAFGVTTIQTDTQDLYKQTIKNNKYLLDGQWKPLRIRNQTIIIKTEKGKIQYQHVVKFTHRGPIMHYLVGASGTYQLTQSLSLAWAGLNQDYQSMANSLYFFEIDNFSQLSHHFQQQTAYGLSSSILVATSDNHILYQHAGPTPIRHNVKTGSYIKDGSISTHDWLGFLKPEQHLQIVDPPRGYIVAANNRASHSHFQRGIFNHSILTARSDRLEELIETEIKNERKITNQFSINLLYDTVDVHCKQILPSLVDTLQTSKQALNNFNCDFASNSTQATIYEVFLYQLWHLIKPEPVLNVSILVFHTIQQGVYKYIQTAINDINKQSKLKEAWNNMNRTLTEFFSTQDTSFWKWGLYHKEVTKQLPLGHSSDLSWLYNRESQGFGNMHTVNIAKSNKIQFGNFEISHRAVYRGIYDFCGPSWFIMDTGASENPFSPHYDDQYKLFFKNKLLPMHPGTYPDQL